MHWNRAAIDRAIDTLQTQTVMLPKPVPLLLAYWTVDLREDGRVGFRPDVYRRDPPLLAALARPRVSPGGRRIQSSFSRSTGQGGMEVSIVARMKALED